jgi:hypothetical protein
MNAESRWLIGSDVKAISRQCRCKPLRHGLLFAQNRSLDERRKIIFPDVPGYLTLKCDLHQHTVFSDGHVWPTIRVSEALKDNLDAIAVTEHIEYQPHKHDIPHPNRNRAYEIEVEEAKGGSLIIIAGSEITREMPPGHANAIFLKDVNKLIIDDPIAVFREAKNQGAFTFWNHPNWIVLFSRLSCAIIPASNTCCRTKPNLPTIAIATSSPSAHTPQPRLK